MTVRFTSVRAIGERGKIYMKNRIKYSNKPIEAHVVNDFLPKPENLVLKERRTRVTLTLTEKSLDFFKNTARRHKASYQAMI